MRAAGALLIGAIACGHEATAPTPAPVPIDAALPFLWREDATAVVRERIVRPRGRVQELTYDLSIARAGDHERVTLSGFRDGADTDTASGALEPAPVDRLGLTFDQPALAAAISNRSLALDVTRDGRFLGSPLVDDTLAALGQAPPGARAVADQARAMLDTPAIRDGTRAHLHDLWITWSEIWRGPDAHATAPGRYEAHRKRPVTTESDQLGNGAIFTPTGPPFAIHLDDDFTIDLSAQLAPPSLRPEQITLVWSRRDEGEASAAELVRIEYRFAWSR